MPKSNPSKPNPSKSNPSNSNASNSNAPQPMAIQIEIQEPRDQGQVYAGHVLYLRASASTASKDLGDRIRWRSDLDGFLGKGAEIQVQLSEGEHRIRARVRRRKVRRSADQPDAANKARSQGGGGSQGDSEDGASDTVTVHSVPVDYPGGDT